MRESAVGSWYFGVMQRTVLAWLQRKRIKPNTVTAAGLLVALMVPVGFGVSPWLGFIFIALSGMADSLDGFLAREIQQHSAFGAFWDSSLDRGADCAILAGFWVLFWAYPAWRFVATVAVFVALMLTMMISYTKAKVEGQGKQCSVGLMGRPVRFIFLLLWALLLALVPGAELTLLSLGLGIYLVLTGITVGQRILEARRVLK